MGDLLDAGDRGGLAAWPVEATTDALLRQSGVIRVESPLELFDVCRFLAQQPVPRRRRVAIVSNSTLQDFQVETTEKGLTRGNVYRGVITNIQPSLNAAFVDFGEGKHGFLPFHDVVDEPDPLRPQGVKAAPAGEQRSATRALRMKIPRDAARSMPS